MSVDSVNRNSDYNSVQRQQTKDKESSVEDSDKRHRREVARLEKQHAEEMESLRNNYSKQIDEMRKDMQDYSKKRDVETDKKITELGNTFGKNLKEKDETNQAQREAERETFKKDRDKQKDINASQTKRIADSYGLELKDKDVKFRELSTKMHDDGQTELHEKMGKQNKFHQVESDAYRKNTDVTVSELRTTIADARKNRQNEKEHDEMAHMNNRQFMEKNFEDTVMSERKKNSEAYREFHEGGQKAIQDTHEKYQQAIKDFSAKGESERNQFAKDVNTRAMDHETALQSRVRDLSTDKNIMENKLTKQSELEKTTLRKEMQKNITSLEDQRVKEGEFNRQHLQEELINAAENRDQALHGQNIFYNDKISEEKMMARNRYDQDIEQVKVAEKSQEVRTDSRVRKMKDYTDNEVKASDKYFKDTVQQMKESHQGDMAELRTNMMQERNQAVGRLEQYIHEYEGKAQEKLDTTVQNYEGKINELKRNNELERRKMIKEYETRLDTQNKSSDEHEKSVIAQNDYRLQELSKQHQEDLRKLNERHNHEKEDIIKTSARIKT